MNQQIASLPIGSLVVPFAAFGLALLVCLVVRSVVFKLLYDKITAPESLAFIFLNTIRFPSVLWCIAAALAIAIHKADASPQLILFANKGIEAFTIISVTIVVASVLVTLISIQGRRYSMNFAVSGLSRTLTHVVVFSIGALLLLKQIFHYDVTPILTALGVGGLAVALALQDTFANFFAGVHILIEEPIALGDFIRLSSGEEGIVKDIGWRTTRIQSAGANITVIPNTKITSSTLTNFSLPDRRVSVDIPILVAHEADHNLIAAIALDVASEAPHVLADPSPQVLFDPGVLHTHLQMKLVVQVETQQQRGVAQSVIRRRLLERFREHGVPLPRVNPS